MNKLTLTLIGLVAILSTGCNSDSGSSVNPGVVGVFAIDLLTDAGNAYVVSMEIGQGQYEERIYYFPNYPNLYSAVYRRSKGTYTFAGDIYQVTFTQHTCPTGKDAAELVLKPLANEMLSVRNSDSGAEVTGYKINSLQEGLAEVGNFVATEDLSCNQFPE